MRFLNLLGKRLKDDEVVDVLERSGIDVVYDFDRSHENIEDIYWAPSKEGGFVLKFGSKQILETIFLYASPIEGFSAIDRRGCDVPFFGTIDEAVSHAVSAKILVKRGVVKLLGIDRNWVRLEHPGYGAHYEYRGGPLAVVTITKS